MMKNKFIFIGLFSFVFSCQSQQKNVQTIDMQWLHFVKNMKKDSIRDVKTLFNTAYGIYVRHDYPDTIMFNMEEKQGISAYFFQDAGRMPELVLSSYQTKSKPVFLPNRCINMNEFTLNINGQIIEIVDTNGYYPITLNEMNLFSFKKQEYLLLNFDYGNIWARTRVFNYLFLYKKTDGIYKFVGRIDTLMRYYDMSCWGDFDGDNYVDFINVEDNMQADSLGLKVNIKLYSENQIDKSIVFLSDAYMNDDEEDYHCFWIRKFETK